MGMGPFACSHRLYTTRREAGMLASGGGRDAVQIGPTTPLDVGEPPPDRPEMGPQVRDEAPKTEAQVNWPVATFILGYLLGMLTIIVIRAYALADEEQKR